MKKITQFTFKLTLISILLLTATCKENLVKVTKLEIGSETLVTESTATVNATFIDVSGNVNAFGHCYATSSNPGVSDGKTTNSGNAKKGDYSSNLTGLTPNTKYYVRAYALEGEKAIYSTKEISFTTLEAKYINITAPLATDNWTKGSTQTITWTDNIDENVHIELFKGGTLLEDIEASTESDGSHNWTLRDGLTLGTDYNIKISSVDDASISAQSEEFEISETPNISITEPTGSSNWQKGSPQTIEWTDNLSENVKIELFKDDAYDSDIATDTPSDGSEDWTVPTTLNADNNYTIKINSVSDESISDESENFTISVVQPTVITTDASSITGTTATLNGTVNANGENINVSFEWGETTASGNTVTATPATVGGSTVTSVSANITGLTAGTTYHFNLKAGSEYGGDKDFTTTTPSSPTVTTGLVSNVAYTTAPCGGDVTDEGSEAVAAKGVCWSTSQYPTIFDYKTNDGTGAGDFSSDITGLSENTTYYVRAYATNSVGTSYGEQEDFKTEDPPVVVTNPITRDYITASGGGEVTHVGSLSVTAKGVCWSTSQNPEITDNKTTDGSGIGSFTSSITGLEIGITYHVKAYATNSLGTIYGNQESFTTRSTVNDYIGNTYDVVEIGNQIWMAENLKSNRYNDGGNIPYKPSSTDWSSSATPGYCYYDGGGYGILYNWYVVNTGKLCPSGWHVPSETEFTALMNYLGGQYVAGGKLKETGTSHWSSPNSGASNETGFTALPGGVRSYNGAFIGINETGYWWSTIAGNIWSMSYNDNDFNSGGGAYLRGCSVRCVKD